MNEKQEIVEVTPIPVVDINKPFVDPVAERTAFNKLVENIRNFSRQSGPNIQIPMSKQITSYLIYRTLTGNKVDSTFPWEVITNIINEVIDADEEFLEVWAFVKISPPAPQQPLPTRQPQRRQQ